MKIDYKPLMSRTDIPWHNPSKLTPDKVDPNNEGWRLIVESEHQSPPTDAEIYHFYWSKRIDPAGSEISEDVTYRTLAPLPEKYRHLLEPSESPKPERVLTPEAQHDRDQFESQRAEFGRCQCSSNPPCSYCTHPGNPANQAEDESCWMDAPAESVTTPSEPDYSSKEHILSVVAAALDGKQLQYRETSKDTWANERVMLGVYYPLFNNYQVRIAPEKKRVPLDDYRPSELIQVDGRMHVILTPKGKDANYPITMQNLATGVSAEWSAHTIFLCGKIHRNGEWQNCYKEVEVQG